MYLLDSDAARKLCQYELINELAQALSCSLADMAILPQLPFQLRLNNPAAALKKLGSEAAVAQAEALIRHAKIVEVRVDQSNFFLDVERPDIDSGEAVLFAALYQSPDDRMLSGDKKAFVALSRIDASEATDSLWVRLICLEEALVLILKHGQFEQISAKVRARSDVDMTLSMAFGRSQAAEESNVLDALASYLGQLHRDTRQLWVPLELKSTLLLAASGGISH